MWFCLLYVGDYAHLTKIMWASKHSISSPDGWSQTREEMQKGANGELTSPSP